jgi:hypothetical protein
VFDGTTYSGDALAVVARYSCEKNSMLTVRQHLIKFTMLKQSVTSDDLFYYLLASLGYLGIQKSAVPAFIHDSAATNIAALSLLKTIFPTSVDVKCITHALSIGATHDPLTGQLADQLDQFQALECFLPWNASLLNHEKIDKSRECAHVSFRTPFFLVKL